jgi:hypothetical protein
MTSISIRCFNPVQAYKAFTGAWPWLKSMLIAGHRINVIFKTETRSIAQNDLMWSCLTDLSKQVKWFGKYLTPEGWKDFITGHLEGQDLVPNMDGTGFISIGRGKSTSKMTIKEMTAVIELCHAFGAENNVNWSPTSLGRDVMDLERLAA